MPLAPRTQLGPYEILGLLGVGGMGEVYRAQDARLKREVALKVLSPEFAQDAERLSRFAREAQILASLNHPGIAAVHGLEGAALVLELVEGPTLSERSGPMPWDEALPILQQLIDAIEYAHERGVIHRDLKPDNIKITPEGRAKVLDFGLAKALAGDPGTVPQNPANSPTLTMHMGTVAGVIMGTAAYMAPEQARGKQVDKRADIWAFGVVVYELLSGKRLFEGETVSDILAQTLTKEIDFAAVPPQAGKLLRRCLDRDPRTRLRDIGEARPLLINAEAPTAAPASPRRPWLPALGIAAALLLGAGAGYWLRSPPAKPNAAPLLHFSFTQPGMAEGPDVRISPDGKRLAYLADGKLWLRDLETGQAKAIEGTGGAKRPFWSPDSTTIAYSAQSQVWKVEVNGALPVALARVQSPNDGCISSDGKTALVHSGKIGFIAIPLAGGPPKVAWNQPIEASGAATGFQRCTVLPLDGPMRWVLANLGQRLNIVDLQAATPQEVGSGVMAVYSAAGYLVFLNRNVIQAAPFSLRDRKFTGTPVDLAFDGTAPDVSSTGVLVYSGGGNTEARLVIRDRKGASLGTAGAPQLAMQDLTISPDGRRLAVSSTEQGTRDIWIHEFDRAIKTRLTTGEGYESRPQWSPDGSQIVYNTELAALEVVSADGSRAPERIIAASAVSDWSPDGGSILHWVITPNNITSFSTRSGPGAPWHTTPYLTGRFDQSFGKFSRDGRFVAYVSNESGEYEVYVRSFPSGPGKWRVTPKGGIQPRWSRNGKEIFYLDNGVLMAVPFTIKGDTFIPGTPEGLFDTGAYQSSRTTWKYDELPGGRFVVIERGAAGLEASRTVHVVSNWQALLERKSAKKE